MTRWLWGPLLLALAFTVGVAVHRTADVVRGVAVQAIADGGDGVGAPPVSSPAFPDVAGLLVGTTFAPGHQVGILTDLELYDALLADLRAARRSITFFEYYCEPGRLVDRVVDVLAERARAGVRVLFMGDGFSCTDVIDRVGPVLLEAGANVAEHRPVALFSLHKAQHRNHSRLVVIDGEIGYTGGFGLADAWIGENGALPWRDTSVRFTGPAVRQMQAVFLVGWTEATGIVQAGPIFLAEMDAGTPDADAVRPVSAAGPRAALLHSTPGIATTAAERLIALSLGGARERIRITNAYFVPTRLVRDLLIDAARRGVDVQILLPGPQTDVPSTRWAGRGFYEDFLSVGIRIFEYQPTVLHTKTMAVDGIWSMVGSINLDNRSIRLNDESALLVHDGRIAAELDSLFQADRANSREITLVSHRARPLWSRVLEWATRLIAPLL